MGSWVSRGPMLFSCPSFSRSTWWSVDFWRILVGQEHPDSSLSRRSGCSFWEVQARCARAVDWILVFATRCRRETSRWVGFSRLWRFWAMTILICHSVWLSWVDSMTKDLSFAPCLRMKQISLLARCHICWSKIRYGVAGSRRMVCGNSIEDGTTLLDISER